MLFQSSSIASPARSSSRALPARHGLRTTLRPLGSGHQQPASQRSRDGDDDTEEHRSSQVREALGCTQAEYLATVEVVTTMCLCVARHEMCTAHVCPVCIRVYWCYCALTQVAVLVLGSVCLLSLRWFVTAGPAALLLPVALLSVPGLPGSALRRLLCEGFDMARQGSEWMRTHQRSPAAAQPQLPVQQSFSTAAYDSSRLNSQGHSHQDWSHQTQAPCSPWPRQDMQHVHSAFQPSVSSQAPEPVIHYSSWPHQAQSSNQTEAMDGNSHAEHARPGPALQASASSSPAWQSAPPPTSLHHHVLGSHSEDWLPNLDRSFMQTPTHLDY
ncbi:hypothetical protein V8C86DRAFT_2515471 [Haematococcus lacustris]